VFHLARVPSAPVEQLALARAELCRLTGEIETQMQSRSTAATPAGNQR
jgi:hypothetical protein